MIMMSMRASVLMIGGLLVTPVAKQRVEASARQGVPLVLDTARSVVRWTGTKFRGRGKHEGTVQFASGFVSVCGVFACGGRFVLDMRSIAVTDIPVSDEVPRTRLQRHLNSRDFFWTEQYPTATFTLHKVTLLNGDRYRVHGDLLLRGVARPLSFGAQVETLADGGRRILAALVIDRTKWGVEYRFDPIRNELVDDDIALRLELVFAKRQEGG